VTGPKPPSYTCQYCGRVSTDRGSFVFVGDEPATGYYPGNGGDAYCRRCVSPALYELGKWRATVLHATERKDRT